MGGVANRWIVWAAALAVFAVAALARADDEGPYRGAYELGYQFASGLVEDGVTRNRPYIELRGRYDPEFSEGYCDDVLYAYEAAARLWYDAAINEGRVDIRSAKMQRLGDTTSLVVGFQEIAWGETFGVFIADIVNPRDLTDPLFNEIAWQRRPVFAINGQLFDDPWSFQVIVTPVPRHNLLPGRNSAFYLFPPALAAAPLVPLPDYNFDDFGHDAEYGGRLGFLFKSGLDLSAFYYRHWNRNPIWAVQALGGTPSLVPVLDRIHTMGTSFTKAKDEIVYRGDLLVHVQQPWSPAAFGTVVRRDVWQMILGLDTLSAESWNWGAQVHVDHWKESTLLWVSGQASRVLCKGKREVEIFVFKGLNNHDFWVQPRLTWNLEKGVTVSLRADIVSGTTRTGGARDGIVGPFKDKDRLFLWITRKI